MHILQLCKIEWDYSVSAWAQSDSFRIALRFVLVKNSHDESLVTKLAVQSVVVVVEEDVESMIGMELGFEEASVAFTRSYTGEKFRSWIGADGPCACPIAGRTSRCKRVGESED